FISVLLYGLPRTIALPAGKSCALICPSRPTESLRANTSFQRDPLLPSVAVVGAGLLSDEAAASARWRFGRAHHQGASACRCPRPSAPSLLPSAPCSAGIRAAGCAPRGAIC